MMVVDTISVSYDSLEELMERQTVIEQTIMDYVDEKQIADRYDSQIRIDDNRYYLTVNLIKD